MLTNFKNELEVFSEDKPCAFLWYIVEQSGPGVQVVLHLVLCTCPA